MSAFHAYDFRGVYGTDFDLETVYRFGYFLPNLLKANNILIGRDARVSSPDIHEAMCRGICDSGASVTDAGLCTTPMVYFGTASLGFGASVMITASHNAKQYNGLKVSGQQASPIGFDNGLGRLQEMVESALPCPIAATRGEVQTIDLEPEYLSFQRCYKADLSALSVAIDCSNGMAGLLARKVFGDTPNYLFDTPDGNFPNHEPNPLNLKNCAQIIAQVQAQKADIGLIFDGDADRVMCIDNLGRFVSPDLIIALMGKYFLAQNPEAKVLQDVRSSKSIAEYLAPMGAEVHTWKVGRAYAATKLREIDGLWGGELAGHYYFRDFFYSDSAIMAAQIILQVVAEEQKKGNTFADLIDEIRNYENSGEINFSLQQKKEAMQSLLHHFTKNNEHTSLMDFDGYRIEFPDWWFSIRASNTEPYLRLLVEAQSAELLATKRVEITNIIQQFK